MWARMECTEETPREREAMRKFLFWYWSFCVAFNLGVLLFVKMEVEHSWLVAFLAAISFFFVIRNKIILERQKPPTDS